MNTKSKFDELYESVIPPEHSNVLEERRSKPTPPKRKSQSKRRKASDSKKKIKRALNDKPLDHTRRDMKLSRGEQRKRQNFVPLYRMIKSSTELPTAKKILNVAKKASSGIWKLTKRQVVEIATKYHFNIPGPTKRIRHLGSTGIIMWRKNANDYYLIKFSKHQLQRGK